MTSIMVVLDVKPLFLGVSPDYKKGLASRFRLSRL